MPLQIHSNTSFPYASFLYKTYRHKGFPVVRSWGITLDYGYETKFVAIRRNILNIHKSASRDVCLNRTQKWLKRIDFEQTHPAAKRVPLTPKELEEHLLVQNLAFVQTVLKFFNLSESISLKEPLYSAVIRVQEKQKEAISRHLKRYNSVLCPYRSTYPAFIPAP